MVDRAALVEHELTDVDQLARELAHDVHADERLVGHTEHELDEPVREARDPRLRVGSERRTTGLVVEPAGSRLLLGEPDPRGLRDREDGTSGGSGPPPS